MSKMLVFKTVSEKLNFWVDYELRSFKVESGE